MNSLPHQFRAFAKVAPLVLASTCLLTPASAEEEVFEYEAGGFNAVMGDNANIGGFIFPELYAAGTWGVFDGSTGAEDYATGGHDPQNDLGIQSIEMHLGINLDDVVTGMIAGFGHMGAEGVWEAELEEAFLHYWITDNIAIGGGQFLSRFGFQATNHAHDWQFVNQNLVNSRVLNEGELIVHGGEILFKTPGNGGLLTLGGGGVRSHSHNHDHGHDDHEDDHDEHDHDDEHDDDHDDHDDDHDEHDHEEGEHHFEADDAGFANFIVSADYRFRLPFDDSVVLSTSLAFGENGFNRDTTAYGFGFQKVWNGHDHGAGPEFCSEALMLQSEFIGRKVNAYDEDGDSLSFDDYGISTSLLYGLSDKATLSLRHDWITGVEIAELSESQRISAALTAFVDPGQRIRTRIQYDYTMNDDIGGEHAAWLQVQIQWGGLGGSHANHAH
ncbi:MAG: hypothetical protein P1U86_07090 [Verrucomicrobiales bacterium]|nr:hypothetical protein [Verrucomicrobiales bacterium]